VARLSDFKNGPVDEGWQREHAARFLETHTGPYWRRAAAVLRGAPAGRPRKDDDASLAAMAEMLDHDLADSIEDAAWRQAGTLIGETCRTSAAKRLARKFRKRKV
jgi:hypothetical protein